PVQLWRSYERRHWSVGFDFVFNWAGGRDAEWRCELSPDNPKLPAWDASFRGRASWADGVNVQLSYASTDSRLQGEETLESVAPTMMDPTSIERLKRPGIWVDFASSIVNFLDGLPNLRNVQTPTSRATDPRTAKTEVLYRIERYQPGDGAEELYGSAQIYRAGKQLWVRTDDDAPTSCPHDSIAATIAETPALHEVRSYDVTRVIAADEIVVELPLLLRGEGIWNSQDYEHWGQELYCEHIDGSGYSDLPYDENCVLYVNGDRWSRWRGDVMLPDSDGGIRVVQEWLTLTRLEGGDFASVPDTCGLSLATPSVAVSIPLPDHELRHEPEDFPNVRVMRRDGSVERDAEIILQWLISGPIELLAEEIDALGGDEISDLVIVELFVEVAINGRADRFRRLSYAAARPSRFTANDNWSWDLVIKDLSPKVVEATLDLIAQQNQAFHDIVTAARDPRSPEAQARDARIAAVLEDR
ncbi:MAG: hypothetical protein WCI74_19940, partial [Actinomycetes bacterium]